VSGLYFDENDPVHTTAKEMKEGETAYCAGPGAFSFIRKGERVDIYLLWNLPLRRQPHEDQVSIPINRRYFCVVVPKDWEQRIRDLLASEEANRRMYSMKDDEACFPVVFD